MLKHRFRYCLLILSAATATATAMAAPERVSARVLDLGRVHTLYMVPEMVTIIEVPGPVTGVRSGSERIRYVIHKAPENEVSLYLNGAEAPTNLIIRSNKKKFIFDIIPNHKIHQDALEVLGDYGAPALDGELGIKLIESSDAKERSQ